MRDRLLGAAKMEQEEVRDHRVERGILEQQLFGVALAELELRMTATSECEHPLCAVNPDDGRATLGGPGGGEARTGGDVEHAVAAADVRRVEQRIDEARRDRAEEVLVAAGLFLPAAASNALNASASTLASVIARAILPRSRGC